MEGFLDEAMGRRVVSDDGFLAAGLAVGASSAATSSSLKEEEEEMRGMGGAASVGT
jgi:hypothetical protein